MWVVEEAVCDGVAMWLERSIIKYVSSFVNLHTVLHACVICEGSCLQYPHTPRGRRFLQTRIVSTQKLCAAALNCRSASAATFEAGHEG